MVSPYLLRKVYADLVSDDGEVLVVYLGWLRTAGLRTAYAAVERYAPDGTRTIVRGRPPAAEPVPGPDGSTEFPVSTSDGRVFRLVHHEPLPGWLPAGEPIAPTVHWQVRTPRARATAGWDGEPPLTGRGYCDHVEMFRPPRFSGLARLRWGRLHLPDATVVFNTVTRPDGTAWAQVAQWDATGVRTVTESDGSPTDYSGSDGPADTVLKLPGAAYPLSRLRVLHAGEPIDSDRFPGRLLRTVGRLANGPSYETRWLSRATGPDGATGTALHESVRFGRPPS